MSGSEDVCVFCGTTEELPSGDCKRCAEEDERNERKAKALGFSSAEEMRGELRRSGLIP